MDVSKEDNSTASSGSGNHSNHSESPDSFQSRFDLYVGILIAIGVIVVLGVVVAILLVLYRHGKFRKFRSRRESLRRLFVRGFSTVSQRGVIDSTAEFEMINTSVTTSVSSENSGKSPSGAKGPPKKPERRGTRTSSSNAKYENVTLDPKAGFVVRKSASMASGIPYMDSTLDSRLNDDEEVDDVFE